MAFSSKVFAFVLVLATIKLSAQTKDSVLTSGGKLKPEQAIMDIRHYTIQLGIDFNQHAIEGSTTIDFILSKPTRVLLFDLMDDYKIKNILVNGKKQAFDFSDKLITILLDKDLPEGRASVKVFYGGKPHVARRPPWDDGFTWTKDSTGHQWMAITAEGAGGKLYFPCKDHPSDEPNEGVDLIITVPKGLVVAGPGLLQSIKKHGETATFHWKTNYTINNYSILFNVGDYQVFSRPFITVNGTKTTVQFYVLKEHADKAEHFLDVFEKTIHEQEKYFGEYPFAKEKMAMVETPHLGMEHQTMVAYGNKFRYAKIGGEDYDWLMHHEFGHEWWGNKVTAKDWADYWIHEGICSFGDALYTREFEGEAAYNEIFQQSIFGIQNQLPVVQHPDMDEEAAYINDIYSKGAFFMHTLRYVVGDSLFFPALKKFVTSPQYTYDNLVNTDDVEQFFTKESGRNLKPLFDLYLRTTAKLEIHVQAKPGNKYLIQLTNIGIPLPMDVVTDSGIKHILANSKGVTIESKTLPVFDPEVFYFKKVVIE